MAERIRSGSGPETGCGNQRIAEKTPEIQVI
jgi:hypothetical protein